MSTLGRKRKLRMTIKVVPRGTLKPNPNNPHYAEGPEERRKGITRVLAEALAKIAMGKEKAAKDARVEMTSEPMLKVTESPRKSRQRDKTS